MAFKIHGEVTLDGAMFKRGLREIGGESTAFIKNFALGAVGIASVEQAFTKTVEKADELVNTSKNLSMTVEQLQLIRQAAKENGVEFASMTIALEKFNAVRENVLQGGKGAAAQMAALGRLGISREALQNQTAAQSMMGQVSDTARKSNAADIAKDLKEVFGRGGDQIFGVLKTNFDELGAKMRAEGAMMDTLTAVQLKTFKDEMDFAGQILTSELAPGIVMFARAVLMAVGHLQSFASWLGTLTSKTTFSKISRPIAIAFLPAPISA
jgi:hypothetical protein